jgi:hypothetical protein
MTGVKSGWRGDRMGIFAGRAIRHFGGLFDLRLNRKHPAADLGGARVLSTAYSRASI